jgi:hypothetical protein
MELDSRVRREAWILIIAGLFMSASQSLSSVALPIVLLEHGSGAGGVGTVLALMNLRPAGEQSGLLRLLRPQAAAGRGHGAGEDNWASRRKRRLKTGAGGYREPA